MDWFSANWPTIVAIATALFTCFQEIRRALNKKNGG